MPCCDGGECLAGLKCKAGLYKPGKDERSREDDDEDDDDDEGDENDDDDDDDIVKDFWSAGHSKTYDYSGGVCKCKNISA